MSYAIHKGAYNWSVNTGFRDEYGVIGVDVGRSSSLSRKSGEKLQHKSDLGRSRIVLSILVQLTEL